MGEYRDREKGSRGNGNDAVLEEIAWALQGLRYGSVEIVIHDSRVVQIERRERVYLSDSVLARAAAEEWRSKADG